MNDRDRAILWAQQRMAEEFVVLDTETTGLDYDDEAVGFVNAMASRGDWTALMALRLDPYSRRKVSTEAAKRDLNWRLEEVDIFPKDTAEEAWKAVADYMQTSCYCDEGHVAVGTSCLLCFWSPIIFVPEKNYER